MQVITIRLRHHERESRVVDGVGGSPSLSYPPHFANLIVVAGDPRGISPKELYRLLRPCGGRLTFAGPGKDAGRGFIRAAEIAESEVRDGPNALSVVRGALDGAWNVRVESVVNLDE